ncbi:MAG: acyl-CoA dehydrogenase, partial [Chrysiogenales bacterium]
MSDRPENNPYTFNEFLQWRNGLDYYRDDPFIRKTIRRFAGDEWESIDAEARRLSPVVSFRWREMAESAALPEKRPWMAHYDGHHNRIDRIVRPREVEIMEREIFSEKLFSSGTSPMTKLMKMYLSYQNGEACIACPLTCTEGMVAILERFADTP